MDEWSTEQTLTTSPITDTEPADEPDEGEWGEETDMETEEDEGADPTIPASEPDDDWEEDSVSSGVVIGDTEEPSIEDEVSTDDTEDNIIDDTEVYPDEPSDYTVDPNDELA